MKVVPVGVGAVGFDTLTPITAPMIAALRKYQLPGTRTGFTFLVRYLENLTLAELTMVLAAGFGMVFVGESRPNGYIPSAGAGSADGLRELNRVRALGLPSGITVGCDLEGMGGTAQDTIAYANAWADVIRPASDIAMAYVGAGVPLTATQLYLLRETLYWHSLSNVQQVANVDYAMLQAFPTEVLQLAPGLTLPADLNFSYKDKRGRQATMVVADDWPLAA